ncbi:MAG: SIR2 family protein [Bacteroidota bacterium]
MTTPAEITEFNQQIKKEIYLGSGFVPFTGSGISANSGILMSQEFDDYLVYCVWLVLGQPRVPDGKTSDCPSRPEDFTKADSHWNLYKNGWPRTPNAEECLHMKQYLISCLNEDAKSVGEFVHRDGENEPFFFQYKFDTQEKIASVVYVDQKSSEHEHTRSTAITKFDIRRASVPSIIKLSDVDYDIEQHILKEKRISRVSNTPWGCPSSSTSKKYIRQLALRSLSHWTDTLEFLSRTKVGRNGKLYLDKQDDSIIDNFTNHMTRGKQPNFIHNMLSRLSRSLRSRLILTTNFDDLIEKAFISQNEPIHSIPISHRGSLPHYSTVRTQDCLIKLHGDLIDTRADTSIHRSASPEDKKKFFQYLRGPNSPHSTQPVSFTKNHLLVVGYSAKDNRCIEMMKYVLDLDNDFKIYWVCHSVSDQEFIDDLFDEYNGTSENKRVILVVTPRTDLLLWELYQAINLSLPGGGYSFRFTHNVPPTHYADFNGLKSIDDSSKTELTGGLDKISTLIRDKLSSVKLIELDMHTGASETIKYSFEKLSKKHQTIWLELEDYADATCFLWDVLMTISIRKGAFRGDAINILPYEYNALFKSDKIDESESKFQIFIQAFQVKIKLALQRFNTQASDWVIFLYGRNGLGGCSSLHHEGSKWNSPNDNVAQMWGDIDWNETKENQLRISLNTLNKIGIRILYLPFGEKRRVRDLEKKRFIRNLIKGSKDTVSSKGYHYSGIEKSIYEHNTLKNKYFPQHSYEEIIHLFKSEFLESSSLNGEEKARRELWAYGITLFRHSRHSAAMISESVYPCPFQFGSTSDEDNDRKRYNDVLFSDTTPWVKELSEIGVLLNKPGGFYWMNRDVRMGIQKILEAKTNAQVVRKDEIIQLNFGYSQMRPRIHFWIADWYLRAFYSTGHYTPLVEAVYHASRAFKLAAVYHPIANQATLSDKEIVTAQNYLRWISLGVIRRAIRNGEECLAFWCPGLNVTAAFFSGLTEICDSYQPTGGKSRLSLQIKEDLKILKLELDHLQKSILAEGFSKRSMPRPLLDQLPEFRLSAEVSPESFSDDDDSDSDYFGLIESLDKPDEGLWKTPHCKKIRAIFNQNDPLLSSIEIESSGDFPKFLKALRQNWLMNWSNKTEIEQDSHMSLSSPDIRLLDLIWKLYRTTKPLIRLTKYRYHLSHGRKGNKNPPHDLEALKRTTVICYHCIKLLRYLSPQFEEKERYTRVRILSTYGLALGCLNRSSESNRRLNEAHGAALSRQHGPIPVQLARIHVRRAEMSLYRADKRIYPLLGELDSESENPTRQSIFHHLNDAWAAIERAEHSMSGVNHSSFWWYRISLTKLSCFAMISRKRDEAMERATEKVDLTDFHSCLPMRKRQDLSETITTLLLNCLINADSDDFRKIRSIKYFYEAAKLATAKIEPAEYIRKNIKFTLKNCSAELEPLASVTRKIIESYDSDYFK